jgi:purine-binding chemotaxis protein CheW
VSPSQGRSSKHSSTRPRRATGRKRGAATQAAVRAGSLVAVEAPQTGDEQYDQRDSTGCAPPAAAGAEEPSALATGSDPTTLAVASMSSPVPTGVQTPPQAIETSAQTSSSRVEEFLGFRLDGEEYCVWIRSIKEIIRPPEITPIPRSPADILGLISLRGTIVPIFNIRRRLGLPSGNGGPKSRIVVVVLDAGPVGLVVDHVTEVISMNPDALEPPPPTMGEREASLVTATIRLRERIIGVLHLERLVAIDSEAPSRAAA